MIIGTFILDFQTTDFESDAKIAIDLLSDYQRMCKLEDSFALDPPVQTAGWSFAKLFLAGQLVEAIYKYQTTKIEGSKGKKFENKFIAWFQRELKNRDCNAQLKMAQEMKSI